MERRSIELADTVTCGSAYLLEWMREAGYALPARSFVWPNPFPAPDPSPVAAAERAARDGARLEEVVFFGRLEPRKGIVLFVDAIDRLVRQGRVPARVTFLGGRSVRIDGPGLIRDSAEGWPVEVRTITDFGAKEAVAYLSQPGRLAVLPSLQENSSLAVTECLHAGIPFVAAATGGTPELVAPEDRARALVPPDHIALGERIADLASTPLRAVRPRWDFERSLDVWARWHDQSAPLEAVAGRFAERARAADAGTPLVTVCIIHHERPELVRMAVDSVVAQDYPALEAVLVDDGSESAEALAALDALEVEFGERGWRVIRQENRFKGAVRNTAAAAARGEWLLFLDDDNVLFPDAVSRSGTRRALLRCGLRSRGEHPFLRRWRPADRPRIPRSSDPLPGGRACLEPLSQRGGRYLCAGSSRGFRGGGWILRGVPGRARRSVILQSSDPLRPSNRADAGSRLLLPLCPNEHDEPQPFGRDYAVWCAGAAPRRDCLPTSGHSRLSPSPPSTIRRGRATRTMAWLLTRVWYRTRRLRARWIPWLA